MCGAGAIVKSAPSHQGPSLNLPEPPSNGYQRVTFIPSTYDLAR